MRIREIAFTNYRQFKDVVLELPKGSHSDLHVLVGWNGTGKTNLLNGINWCLYEEEPHLTDERRALPLLNINALSQCNDGGDREVSVRVTFDGDEGQCVSFERRYTYRVHASTPANIPSLQDKSFKCFRPGSDHSTDILSDDEAQEFVNRVVPSEIREYFFFDGERLDDYFRETAAQRIRAAVHEIAQIQLLSEVSRKLKETGKKLQRDAAKQSPELKRLQADLDFKEEIRNDLKKQLEECKEQLVIAEQQQEYYAAELRGLPDIESLEVEREGLSNVVKSASERIKSAKMRRVQRLVRGGVALFSLDAIDATIASIESRRRAGDLPPPIDLRVVQKSVESEKCLLCSTDLDESALERVRELRQRITLAADVAGVLQSIDGLLHEAVRAAREFGPQAEETRQDLLEYEREKDVADKRIGDIDSELDKYDRAKVAEWARIRKEAEQRAKALQGNKGGVEVRLKGANSDVDRASHLVRQARRAVDLLRDLEARIEFCEAATEAADAARSQIMEEVRLGIETSTSELYRELVWKKATYKDVSIDQDYNISLASTLGLDAFGSASAAERELLALSFTLAVHQVSGFDRPLVIDTPVARVSDTNRMNFGQALANVSARGKQVLLLFTPAEYSSDISAVVEGRAASRWQIKLSDDEQENRLEELTDATNN